MDDLLAALARYDSPTLANAIETFDLQPRDVGVQVVGCLHVGVADIAVVHFREMRFERVKTQLHGDG